MANNPKIKKGVQPEWLKGKDLKANPQNRNTNGAAKSIQTIINRLKKNEYTTLDKKSLMEIYKLMFNSPENELKKIANHKDTPWGFKIIFENLQDPKTRAKAWMDYQQWLFGKAPDAGDTKAHSVDIMDDNLTDAEKAVLRKLEDRFDDDY